MQVGGKAHLRRCCKPCWMLSGDRKCDSSECRLPGSPSGSGAATSSITMSNCNKHRHMYCSLLAGVSASSSSSSNANYEWIPAGYVQVPSQRQTATNTGVCAAACQLVLLHYSLFACNSLVSASSSLSSYNCQFELGPSWVCTGSISCRHCSFFCWLLDAYLCAQKVRCHYQMQHNSAQVATVSQKCTS